MDQGTQQNAAMVEESTAASHSLAREAEALFKLLATFEIGAASATRRPYEPTPTPVSKPAVTPVHKLIQKVEKSMPRKVASGGGAAVAAAANWEEF